MAEAWRENEDRALSVYSCVSIMCSLPNVPSVATGPALASLGGIRGVPGGVRGPPLLDPSHLLGTPCHGALSEGGRGRKLMGTWRESLRAEPPPTMHPNSATLEFQGSFAPWLRKVPSSPCGFSASRQASWERISPAGMGSSGSQNPRGATCEEGELGTCTSVLWSGTSSFPEAGRSHGLWDPARWLAKDCEWDGPCLGWG